MDQRIEVISRGVLFESGRLLVCRSVAGDYFYLPGGHVEFGESATRALAREFQEEAGLEVAPGKAAACFEERFQQRGRSRHELSLVFHVEHRGTAPLGEVRSLEPEIEFDWLDLAALVDVDFRPISIKAWLMSNQVSSDGGMAWFSHGEAES